MTNFEKHFCDFFKDLIFIKRFGSNKVWKLISATEGEFWSTMPLLHENTIEILAKLGEFAEEITILSSPVKSDKYCIKGKQAWIGKHVGKMFKDPIFVKDKHLYANKESVLIDDQEKKINKWIEHGGVGILYKGNFEDVWSVLTTN